MDNTQNEYKEEIYDFGEAINRLDEIKEDIFDLVNEAANIVRTKAGRRDLIYQRAEAYWIPMIRKTLSNEMEYGTIESTIVEMKKRFEEMKEEVKENK